MKKAAERIRQSVILRNMHIDSCGLETIETDVFAWKASLHLFRILKPQIA